MPPVTVGPKIESSHPPHPATTDAQGQAQPQAETAFAEVHSRPDWLLALPVSFQNRLFAATEAATTTVSSMIQGAKTMAGVVTNQFHLAVRRGQTIGPEIEFFSNMERTDVIRAIAKRYQSAGFQTREIATPFYEFESAPHGFWETRHHFEINGGPFAFHLYEGVGGFVVSAKAPFGVQADILSTGSESEAFDRGCALAAEMLKLPVEQVREAALAGKQRYLLALKSTDKDYFEIQVELGTDGVATLTPLTGKFLDAQGHPTGILSIPATTLEAVKDHLVQIVAGKKVLKNNAVTTIEVQVPGRAEPLTIDNRFDVYPIQEVVPSPMSAGEHATLMAPLLDFFNQPGATVEGDPIQLSGTDGINQVGFQVHREIPWLNGKGQPTIEYALKLHREWIEVAKTVAAIVPTLEARTLFARPLSDYVANLIMDPNFVTDPTSVAQTFDYFGLIVRNTMPKYHDLNLENWFAHHVKVLFDKGLIKSGDTIASAHHGNIEYIVGDGTVTMSYSANGDTHYAALVRIPSSHPIPTAELRTPDTVLKPEYMGFIMNFMAGFGHDIVGTATKDVANLYQSLQKPGNEAVARDFARHPGLPLSIMTLLGLNIPELLVAYRLKGLVGEAAVDAMAPYQALRSDPLVGAVVESIRASGLAAVMGPDATKDPIAQGLNNLIEAGKSIAKLVDSVYLDGVIPSQNLGVEVEFNSPLGRDAIFKIIADAYTNIPGASVTFKTGTHFDFNAESPLHWTISQFFNVDGQTIETKVASGTGGYIISATRTADDAKMRAAAATDVEGALHEASGLVQELLGFANSMVTNRDPHYLMMCKSEDSKGDTDYLKMDVHFNDGTATLTALNGSFVTTNGPVRTLQIPAHELNDVERFLQNNAREEFALKDDAIKEIEVRLPGFAEPFKLKLVYEEHPFLEAVTGILNARTPEVVRPYLDALSNATTMDAHGKMVPVADGMRSGNPLSFQVHAELPYLDASGKMTVAAFLQLQRNFQVLSDSFSALLGPDANRVDFAQKAPDHYVDRISDPNYVKDSTDLVTILNVFGDYVAARPAKYQDFSAEHFTSWFLRTLIQSGKLQMGQTLTSNWHGQMVKFSVRPDKAGAPQIYRVTETAGGFISEQPMIRLAAHQPTAELRIPNALFAGKGRTSEYAEWLLKIATAFVQTHAQLDSKTIAPVTTKRVGNIAKLIAETPEMAELPSAKLATATPPPASLGYATVDTMSLGGIRAISAVMNAINAIPNSYKQAAANTVRGGTTMYLGQLGADVIDALRSGDWEPLRAKTATGEVRDLGALMGGSKLGAAVTNALVKPIPTSVMSKPFKGFATHVGSLAAGITLLNALRTGELSLNELPKTIAVTLAASGTVRAATTILSQSRTLCNAAEFLKLSKAGRATLWGAVVTSVAEFTLMREIERQIFRSANQPNIDQVKTYMTQLIQADMILKQARDAGEPVDMKVANAVQTQLQQLAQQLKTIPDIDEQIAIAKFEQEKLDIYNGKYLAIAAGISAGDADWNMTRELRRLERKHTAQVATIRGDLDHKTPESLRTAMEFQPEDVADAGIELPGDYNGTVLQSATALPLQDTLGDSWSALALQLNDYLSQKHPLETLVAMN